MPCFCLKPHPVFLLDILYQLLLDKFAEVVFMGFKVFSH